MFKPHNFILISFLAKHMKLGDIFLCITVFMFIITASDPIDIHIADSINIFYKALLAFYSFIFAMVYFLETSNHIPTIVVLINTIKIFVPSHIIGNNEFIALYHRLNIAAFVMILLIIVARKYSMIATMVVPKHIIDNTNVNITIIILLKTAFTLIPTIFKFGGYILYITVLLDILRIIAICVYIFIQFSKFKKKKEQEQINVESDTESESETDSDTESESEQAFVYDALDEDTYEEADSPNSSDSDIDFESFMSTLSDQ